MLLSSSRLTLQQAKSLSAEDSKILAGTVNAILNDERVSEKLETASAAALVAGKLQLKGCIPALVRRITLPSPPRPRTNHIRGNPLGAPPSCMSALISIGKPALPAIRQLAARDDLTEIERVAANAVIQQIERRRIASSKKGELE